MAIERRGVGRNSLKEYANYNLYTMKKILFILVTLLAVGCSEEESYFEQESKDQLSEQFSARIFEGISPEFTTLFTELYDEAYRISDTTKAYYQDKDTYLVTKLYVEENNVMVLQGYYIETPGNVVYLEHISSTGTLNHFEIILGSAVKTVYNLNNDPNYAVDGFSPDTPLNLGKRRFWGSGPTTVVSEYQGNGYCMDYCDTPYYILWIDVSGPRYPCSGLYQC